MKDESFGIIAVYKESGQNLFLLIQHKGGSEHWSFPKGHREGKETNEQAAVREFQEETGIKEVSIFSHPLLTEHYVFRFNGVLLDKTVTYYIGEVTKPKVALQAEEVKDSVWLPFEEAIEKLTFKQGKELLKKANLILNS